MVFKVFKNNLILILISFQSYSQSNIQIYIQQYQDIAVNHMHEYGIPASIKLAQGILESSYGTSKLAKESNNHFGIKCHKDWAGAVVYHDDDEKDECFRKYDFVEDSYLDHSLFLVNKERYSSLFELKKNDYRNWAKGLKKAGYATNPDYANKLIQLIETYNLSYYDNKETDFVLKEESLYKIKQYNYVQYVTAKAEDTYDEIAEYLGVWPWELIKYNDASDDRVLLEGERVYIQPKRKKCQVKTHEVIEGETMYSISQLYAIKIADLYKKNKMKNGTQPEIGQVIYLKKEKNNLIYFVVKCRSMVFI